jgi:Carboxypeptidase regulatory-like domain
MMRTLLGAAILCCLLGGALALAASGRLEGSVSRGPLAPVERPGILNSAPVAGAAIEIATPAGKKIATVQSDSNGRYSAQLPPGTYRVVVTSPAAAFHRKNVPATVTLKAGQITRLDIRLDTGIR